MKAERGSGFLFSVFVLAFALTASADVAHDPNAATTARPAADAAAQQNAMINALSACLVGQGASLPTTPPLVYPDPVVNDVPPGAEELPTVPPEGGQSQTQVPPSDGGDGGSSDGGGGVTPPPANTDGEKVQVLTGIFGRCVGCHSASTAGASMGDFSLTFGEKAKNGVPGLKDPTKVLAALKTKQPMKKIYDGLSPAQKAALEAWVTASK